MPQDFVWLNGRDITEGSTAYGEVIVQEIALRSAAGSKFGAGFLLHGTKTSLIESRPVPEENRTYHHIRTSQVDGWIADPFIARNWSTFTFLARLHKPQQCRDLDGSYAYRGMEVITNQNSLAIITEGDPAQFDAIKTAAVSLANRLVVAQAAVSAVPLAVEFINWVENPAENSRSTSTIGFVPLPTEPAVKVSNDHIHMAIQTASRMVLVPYLDLALNDFALALRHPDHALIFLARAVESIEYYFENREAQNHGEGKESRMRRALQVSRADVEYITKRANESHRRHADPEGKAQPIPVDELTKCFEKTSLMLEKFVNHFAPLP